MIGRHSGILDSHTLASKISDCETRLIEITKAAHDLVNEASKMRHYLNWLKERLEKHNGTD